MKCKQRITALSLYFWISSNENSSSLDLIDFNCATIVDHRPEASPLLPRMPVSI